MTKGQPKEGASCNPRPNEESRGLEGIICFGDDFQPVTIEYLWEPYLPRGKAVLLDADGGTGKTTWCISVAAGLSRGRLPKTGARCEPERTLYLIGDADEPADYETIYRAHGGVTGMVAWCKLDFKFDGAGLRRLEKLIEQGHFSLVVIDVLYYYLEGVVRDANAALHVSGICRKIGEIAGRTGSCIVANRHTSKGSLGKKASELGLGSQAFRNAFRGQLVMRPHPNLRRVVVVTDEKGSPLVRPGEPFAFRRTGEYGVIEYVPIDHNPFEVQRPRGRPSTSIELAKAAVTNYLTEYGPTKAAEVVSAVVAKCNVAERTVYSAADSIGITSEKGVWCLAPEPESF